MHWMSFAVLAALSFGFYNFFTKISADKLSPTIALMFIAGTSFVVAVVATIVFKLSGQPLTFSKNALWFPIFAGAATGVAEIFYLFMFTKEAPLNIGMPLVIGLTVVSTVVLSFIFLKEPMNMIKIFGIISIVFGLVLLTKG